MGHPVWTAAGAAALAALVLTGVFVVRLRYLAGRVGSFECALRPRGAQRWLSGVASFQLDSLEWYRLVSFSTKPSRSWSRLNLELSEARSRREQGRVVEVHCVDATRSPEGFDLAMMEESHSALVAWVESAAPEQPRLF